MEPIIKTVVATVSTACAAASILYSPRLLLAIASRNDEWRMQMHRPQIDQVPLEVRDLVAAMFLLLAAVMYVDVCTAYPDCKPVIRAGCAIGAGAVAACWFFIGPML